MEVLNRLIFNKEHDTFYKAREKSIDTGKDMDSWTNGCIDVGFYKKPSCRCKNESCTCSGYKQDLILFLSLHGNCKNSPLQKKMMCQLSSVVIVFVDAAMLEGEVVERVLNIIREADKSLVVITKDDKTSSEEALKKLVSQLGGAVDEENLSEKMVLQLLFDQATGSQLAPERMENEMRDKLKEALNECKLIESLRDDFDKMDKDLNNDGKMNVMSDDDDTTCTLGREAAEGIRDKLAQRTLAGVKQTMMPLQVEEWIEWSKVER